MNRALDEAKNPILNKVNIALMGIGNEIMGHMKRLKDANDMDTYNKLEKVIKELNKVSKMLK